MSGLLPLPVPGLSIEQPLPSIVVGRVDSKQVGGVAWIGWDDRWRATAADLACLSWHSG